MRLETDRAAAMLAALLIASVGDAGAAGLPSGEGYALLMAHGVDLHLYERLVAILRKDDILTERAHLLTLTAKGERLYGQLREAVRS